MDATARNDWKDLSVGIQVHRHPYFHLSFIEPIIMNLPSEILLAVKSQSRSQENPTEFNTYILNHTGTRMK